MKIKYISNQKRPFLLSRMACRFSCLLLFTLFHFQIIAQTVLDKKVSISLQEASIIDALKMVEATADVRLAYTPRFFDNDKTVTLQVANQSLPGVLEKILADTGIGFKEIDGQIVLYKKPKKEIQRFTISGFVEDISTGERLISATVYSPEQTAGTITNEYGFYSLTLPETNKEIIISYLGYQEQHHSFELKKNQFYTFQLQPSLTLTEIIVTPDSNRNELLPSPANGNHLRPEEFQAAPDLGGEGDLLRIAQLLPGVQTGADGFGGLHIRGGNADQNLILLDGVPVYNPDHLLGVFSVFNTSAIKSAKLYRGSFPARYGGRISSVFDVRTKEGNNRKWTGSASADLISGKGFIEGPFAKGKGSLLLTARFTHDDFLLNELAKKAFSEFQNTNTEYNFSDINAKVSFTLSETDRLYLSFYKGNDYFEGRFEEHFEEEIDGKDIEFEEKYNIDLKWGNTISSLRWNHVFNPKLFANTTLTYSLYEFSKSELETLSPEDEEDEEDNESYFYNLSFSNIEDISTRMDFNYSPNAKHYVRFGGALTYHWFEPQTNEYDSNNPLVIGTVDSLDLHDFADLNRGDTIHAQEIEAYVEDEFKVGEKWQFNLGVRFSAFLAIDHFFNIEPRLIGHYCLTERSALKASLTRNVQYLHRSSFNEINLPEDVWIPSGEFHKPQEAWQATLGWEGNLPHGLEVSLEGYVKKMKNMLPSVSGADFDFEDEDYFMGKGNGHGIEFFIKKNKGKSGGWLSYTLSKSEREFKDSTGRIEYVSRFDRRHDFKIFLYQQLNKNWQLGCNWVYGSAMPRLIDFNVDANTETTSFPYRNDPRLRAYHRLDIGLTFSKKQKRFEHSLKISAYNIYNRKNTAFYRTTPDGAGGVISKPVHLLRAVPGVYYGIKF